METAVQVCRFFCQRTAAGLPSEAYDPGGSAEAELKGDEGTAEETALILVRALAEAAALTSTSLRERWSEPGDVATAGFLVEGTALAVGQEEH